IYLIICTIDYNFNHGVSSLLARLQPVLHLFSQLSDAPNLRLVHEVSSPFPRRVQPATHRPLPRVELASIVRRHLRTLPPSSDHDLRQRRPCNCKVLRGANPGGVGTDPRDRASWVEPDEGSNPLERSGHFRGCNGALSGDTVTLQPTEDRSGFDMRTLQPVLERGARFGSQVALFVI